MFVSTRSIMSNGARPKELRQIEAYMKDNFSSASMTTSTVYGRRIE